MINIFHQPKFSPGIRRTGRPTYTLEIFCVTRSLRSRASSQALYVYFSEKKNVWKAISELYSCKIFLEPGWDGGGAQKGPAWGKMGMQGSKHGQARDEITHYAWDGRAASLKEHS